MWQGLHSLKQLRLWHNLISFIEPGSFESLIQLEGLYLHNNRLTTLEQNVFGIFIPEKLTLIHSNNPLVCDSRMCWIKQGEEEGQLTLYEVGGQKPSCEDFPGIPWDDVTVICPTPGKLMWIHSWTTKHDLKLIITLKNTHVLNCNRNNTIIIDFLLFPSKYGHLLQCH